MNKLVSVIIVNWNGEKWLKKCLTSLSKQSYPDYEIIFVDNASSDNSVTYVRNHFPKVKVVKNKTNLGYAGGNNVGFKNAKGEFIILLNNDTVVEREYLKKFVKAFDEIPRLGIAQSKIVLMDSPTKLDTVGAYWTDTTYLYHYGFGKDERLNKYNLAMPFFSNKGASLLIRRALINKIGLFDDDFWCYYEETDFCHRVWLAGYECWYYPKVVVYHAMGGTSERFDNSLIQFHNFKNKLLSFIKNFEKRSLVVVIPTYLIINIILSFFWLIQGKYKHSLAFYKSIWWNSINLNNTLKKRKLVQSYRKISDATLFKKTKNNPKKIYYYLLLKGELQKFED